MTDQLHQQVSAFVDNELPEEECSLFVRRLCKDDGLQAAVNRFALIGDAMRGELLAADVHVSEHIRAAIAADTVDAVETQSGTASWARWLRPVSGLAVAATVAAVAVLSLQQGTDSPDTTEFPSSTVAELIDDDGGSLLPVKLPRFNLPEVLPASVMPQSRMDQYLLRHGGYANSPVRQSLMGMRDIGTYTLVPVPAPTREPVETATPE